MRRLLAVCLAASATLCGCSTAANQDPLQVTDRLVAATPAVSPPPARPAQGTVIPAPAGELALVDPATGVLAVAGRDMNLRLVDTGAPQGPSRTVTLPGVPAGLRAGARAGTVLVSIPQADQVARVDVRSGSVDTVHVPGGPADAAEVGGLLVVARRGAKDVAVVDGSGRLLRHSDPFDDPEQVVPAGPDAVEVLDRLATSATEVTVSNAQKGAALRAGAGATGEITDRFGRVLVADTRGGELLAFSTHPLLLKQRYPVPGAPYGIAYDPHRDLAWVALTASNEVVGYDVAGGEPVERFRMSTVRQPNAVAVDPRTGAVFVVSATGEGIQVVTT